MELQIPATAAMWFLPFVLPICIWVAWNDMAVMKIPNKAVMALAAVYAAVGLIALPFSDYAWQWLHLAVILMIGFLMNMGGLIGAGDAKFAAAMAPFVALGDVVRFCYLFAAVLLSAFLIHRLVRAIPSLRASVSDWESWERKDFPMGLALGSVLALYLALGAAYGA